jgi:bifunctional UDP-N-acetylglucosamine pyrophosphorylase/glucosamine-1-phosphate N-acetyltransferase
VARGAIIGAGSTITHDVPAESLVVARSRAVVKAGWAKQFRSHQKKRNSHE